MRVIAELVFVVLAFTTVAPATHEAFAVAPANMYGIKCRYFSGQDSLFTDLLMPERALK